LFGFAATIPRLGDWCLSRALSLICTRSTAKDTGAVARRRWSSGGRRGGGGSLQGCFEGVFFVVIEGTGGFEGETEVVVGAAFVFVEEERVCAGGEREGEIAQDVSVGWLVPAS
jgi:hypothetical protein